MIELFLHDDQPAQLGEPHGPDGPTHRGTGRVRDPGAVEQFVIGIGTELPEIVRIRSPELGREWRRDAGSDFQELPRTEVHTEPGRYEDELLIWSGHE